MAEILNDEIGRWSCLSRTRKAWHAHGAEIWCICCQRHRVRLPLPDDSVRRMSCLCHGNTERDKVPMSWTWIPKLPGFIAAIAHLQQIVA